MAVTLDGLQLVDVLGPEAHDPAHVVAGQVDQHDVLGQLLGVLGQLTLSSRSWCSFSPGARPGDGTRITTPSRSRTIGSGVAPTTVTSGKRRK